MTTYDNALVWIYNHSLYILVVMHWIADFVCQTSYMALGKSKSNKPLLLHVSVYTLPFFFWGVKFALVNGVCHFMVDYVTARFNSKMWARGMGDPKATPPIPGDPFGFRMFWIGIGFDQMVHMLVLLWTAQYLLLAF